MSIKAISKRARIAVSFSLTAAIALANPVLRAQAETAPTSGGSLTLSVPFQTIQYAAEPGTTGPILSRGHLVRFRRYSTTASAPKIYLYSTSGSFDHSVVLWPNGAIKLHLTSVDVGPNSQLTFAGESLSADGVKHPFLATSDLYGNSLRYFSTGTFLSTRIVVAADGSIWCVGIDSHTQLSGDQVRKDNYDVLRHYNQQGSLAEHFLPRLGANAAYVVYSNASTGTGTSGLHAYDKNDNLLLNYVGPRGRYAGTKGNNQNWLTAVGDGILLYDGKSGILYRYSASSGTLTAKRVDVQNLSGNLVTGFAASSDGELYISIQARDREHPLYNDRFFRLAGLTSPFLARWSPIREELLTPRVLGKRPTLLGCDGTAVVFKSKGKQVNWSNVQYANAEAGQ
jgi:hypothetical protein